MYVKIIRFTRLYVRANSLGSARVTLRALGFWSKYVREYQRNLISAVSTEIELKGLTAALISFIAYDGYAGRFN